MFFKNRKKGADNAIFYFQTAGSVPFRLKLYAGTGAAALSDGYCYFKLHRWERTFLKMSTEAFHAARRKTGNDATVRQRRDSANCFVSSVSLHSTSSVSHLIGNEPINFIKTFLAHRTNEILVI